MSGSAARRYRLDRVLPKDTNGYSIRQATCALVCALMLAAAAAGAAGTDPASGTPGKPAKASSLAPHHTKGHVYGAPIQKPIVHKRKKRARAAAPATGPAQPIK